MSELFDRIDALVASRSSLPPPAERKRLRTAHGLTLDEVAAALQVRRATVSSWESGRTEPRPPERDAYARLLKQLAELYPAHSAEPAQGATAPGTIEAFASPVEAPTLSAGPAAAAVTAEQNTRPSLIATGTAPATVSHLVRTVGPSSAARRPVAKKTAEVDAAVQTVDSRGSPCRGPRHPACRRTGRGGQGAVHADGFHTAKPRYRGQGVRRRHRLVMDALPAPRGRIAGTAAHPLPRGTHCWQRGSVTEISPS